MVLADVNYEASIIYFMHIIATAMLQSILNPCKALAACLFHCHLFDFKKISATYAIVVGHSCLKFKS